MKKHTAKNKKNIAVCRFGLNNRMRLFTFFLIMAALAIWISGCNKNIVKQGNPANDPAKDFNVQLDIPQANAGNINNVPKEKIDSLFGNLKQ
jgi:hypothetical protein